jgi:hypothetical protein
MKNEEAQGAGGMPKDFFILPSALILQFPCSLFRPGGHL